MRQLRDYQTETCAQVAQHLRAGVKTVLVVAPTGSGKSTVGSAIVRAAVQGNHRVLWLAHRKELIDQASETLSSFNIPNGLILAGRTPRPYEPVQVASVQTLSRRTVPQADLVVIDEAHHYLGDNQYGRLLAQLPAARVVGLTATPWRLDGRGLADLWEQHVISRTPSELRTQGHLCPVTGWVFQALDVSGVGKSQGDYRDSELARVKLPREILGDVVKEWLARAHGVRTILFACGVEHSKAFVAEFRAAGVAAEHVDGSLSRAERAAIFARVRSGQTTVLSNCQVATEGFDLPELACVVLARPTMSEGLYLQMVGRVLRPAEGKTVARIHDHAGNVARHGEPYAERDYDPRRVKPKGKPEARLPRCPKCDAITSDNPCPECGHVSGMGERVGPETVTEGVQAVALESVTAPRSELSCRHGEVTFSKIGEMVTGRLLQCNAVQGRYGPTERFEFIGNDGTSFYVDAPVDLRAKLSNVSMGSTVRMQFADVVDRGEGRQMKRFKVMVKP